MSQFQCPAVGWLAAGPPPNSQPPPPAVSGHRTRLFFNCRRFDFSERERERERERIVRLSSLISCFSLSLGLWLSPVGFLQNSVESVLGFVELLGIFMAVGATLDQWQKDVFFSAAEEVQESADTLESVYRMWARYHSDGFESEISDELLRELRTSLGTAKWQLEEFERAVNLNHENYLEEENVIARHGEFVSALGNRISYIEKVLSDSLIEEGKQPHRWIQLNEEERDDLAIFLSATPQNPQEMKGLFTNHSIDPIQAKSKPGSLMGPKETLTIKKDANYVVGLSTEEFTTNKVEVVPQVEKLDEDTRTWSSPNIGACKIVIDDGEDSDRKLIETRSIAPNRASSLSGFIRNTAFMAKTKWLKNNLPKAKSGEHLQLRQGLSSNLDLKGNTRFAQGINQLNERSRNCFNNYKDEARSSTVQKIIGRAGGFQRHIQGSQYYTQLGRSLRVSIFLLLTVILVVPFVLYST